MVKEVDLSYYEGCFKGLMATVQTIGICAGVVIVMLGGSIFRIFVPRCNNDKWLWPWQWQPRGNDDRWQWPCRTGRLWHFESGALVIISITTMFLGLCFLGVYVKLVDLSW